jgi:L-methionine (R)-S-oxide reductase
MTGGGPGEGREEAYARLLDQLRAVLDGCPGFLAAMASTAALLKDSFDHVSWVGFYLPAEDGSLVVGPYQGPLACIRLAPGKGVCGTAATRRETVLVPDVHAFPGHIACDARSRSEIVVPVLAGRELLAVLDVDSHLPAAFETADQKGLEEVASCVARAWI